MHPRPADGELSVSRLVQCVLLKREAPGLDRAPYPGELGQRIYEKVSKEAWSLWITHQTMLMNEYRLTPVEPKARKFLEAEMEKFFFGAGSKAPEGFKPPAS
jgi:Fe-S cluster biosynthesis and repair protein YggX